MFWTNMLPYSSEQKIVYFCAADWGSSKSLVLTYKLHGTMAQKTTVFSLMWETQISKANDVYKLRMGMKNVY
jgi:hypothetical protein